MQALAAWPRLTSVTEAHSFLQLVNYYQKVIRDFTRIPDALSELTKSGVIFERWVTWNLLFQNLEHVVKIAPAPTTSRACEAKYLDGRHK
jgi:hypothetical protein